VAVVGFERFKDEATCLPFLTVSLCAQPQKLQGCAQSETVRKGRGFFGLVTQGSAPPPIRNPGLVCTIPSGLQAFCASE